MPGDHGRDHLVAPEPQRDHGRDNLTRHGHPVSHGRDRPVLVLFRKYP